MTGTISAGPEHGCAPGLRPGREERRWLTSPEEPKTKKAETVAPRRTRRKLPSLYGRMFRRPRELVRTALYRRPVWRCAGRGGMGAGDLRRAGVQSARL